MIKSDYIFQLCIYRGFKKEEIENLDLKEIIKIFKSGIRGDVLK